MGHLHQRPLGVAVEEEVGARVEIEDSDRAWPEPGETATVRWLVAHPGEVRPLSWAFRVCPAAAVAFAALVTLL